MRKRPIAITEREKEGFLNHLLGKQVEIHLTSCVFFGKLVGIDSYCIKIETPFVSYDKMGQRAMRIDRMHHYINISHIESFGEGWDKPYVKQRIL
jgi:hypothetical protein